MCSSRLIFLYVLLKIIVDISQYQGKGFADLKAYPDRMLKVFLLCAAVLVGIFLLLILKERFCTQAGLAFLPRNLGPE